MLERDIDGAHLVMTRATTKGSAKVAAGSVKLRPAAAPGFINTAHDVSCAVRALRRRCADMRRVHDLVGDPPLRRYPPGLEGLARIVVGQQLSLASAEAIWRRTRQAVTPFTARRLAAASDAELAAAGLSRGKIRTLRAVALAVEEGGLDIARLALSDDRDVHAALTVVPGIGPWTADIFLLFCAGRADAFAKGDLALQVAAQRMLGLAARPGADALEVIAERWRPNRATAACLLWAYYKVVRAPSSGAPV